MKKILIALDFDPTAQKIAETGYALAKTMKAETILLHVITDPIYYSSPEYSPIMGFTGFADLGPIQLESVESLINASVQYLDNTRQHLGDKTIQTLVKEGEISDTVLKTATDIKAELIVMGSHSRRWLEEILMGSVTEKVLHRSTIPLFIIPTKEQK